MTDHHEALFLRRCHEVTGDLLEGFVAGLERVLAARVAGKIRGKDDSDDSPPPKPLNTAFEAIFRLERFMIGRVPMPPGLSIVTLVTK